MGTVKLSPPLSIPAHDTGIINPQLSGFEFCSHMSYGSTAACQTARVHSLTSPTWAGSVPSGSSIAFKDWVRTKYIRSRAGWTKLTKQLTKPSPKKKLVSLGLLALWLYWDCLVLELHLLLAQIVGTADWFPFLFGGGCSFGTFFRAGIQKLDFGAHLTHLKFRCSAPCSPKAIFLKNWPPPSVLPILL